MYEISYSISGLSVLDSIYTDHTHLPLRVIWNSLKSKKQNILWDVDFFKNLHAQVKWKITSMFQNRRGKTQNNRIVDP